jgi:hypothetical protein
MTTQPTTPASATPARGDQPKTFADATPTFIAALIAEMADAHRDGCGDDETIDYLARVIAGEDANVAAYAAAKEIAMDFYAAHGPKAPARITARSACVAMGAEADASPAETVTDASPARATRRCEAVSHERTCGVCRAGILIEGGVIRACPTCRLFEEDSDAAEAVAVLACILDARYQAAGDKTVADVLDRIEAVLIDTDSQRDDDDGDGNVLK